MSRVGTGLARRSHAQVIQDEIVRQREALLERARAQVAEESAEMTARHEADAAERNAYVEVERERRARRQGAEQAQEPSSSPLDATSEEEAQMATTVKKKRAAVKGQDGLKQAQAHRAEKRGQKPPALVSVKTDAAGKVKEANGEHPLTGHVGSAKSEGVRVARASRGGYHVIVFGTLNRALKGVFEKPEQAQAAAETAGLTVKAMPK